MFFKSIINYFSPNLEQTADVELKNIASEFYISRTGVEMLDERRNNPILGELPLIFTQVYEKNRKSVNEYKALDEKSIDLRDESSSMGDYRKKAEQLHYANCTLLAGFMCDALIKNNFNAKIFGIGSSHHFVIAKSAEPFNLLIIDPWAGLQFKIILKENVTDLEDLSIDSRLAICKAHFQHTNLYPESEYLQPLEMIKSHYSKLEDVDEFIVKGIYNIKSIETIFAFENRQISSPKK